jgi:hypothetical protein
LSGRLFGIPRILWTIAFLSGVLLPFIIVWKSGAHHADDFKVFSTWAECWLKDKNNIYLNCGANYPFVGVIASAGALSALKTIFGVDNYSKIITDFRFYLAIFDSLNFILIFLLAVELKLKNALVASLLIVALPSSWAGGALWGQIDGVSQFFLLACILCLAVAIQSSTDRLTLRSAAYCALGLVALVALVLTKQLGVFSLPAVLPLVLLAQLRLWTSSTKLHGVMATAGTFLPAIALFLFLDSRLEVPSSFHGSGYLFVWLGGGSDHGNVISGNGFNIWMFLGRNMWSSSHKPFYCLQLSNRELCLTPFHSGLVLYGTYILALATLYFGLFWRSLLDGGFRDERQIRFIVATIVLYLAQVNLGFNIFLTGTHERYLYHCFSFLILTAFYFFEQAELLSWRSGLFFLAVATVYGAFVYSVLSDDDSLPSPHRFVAAIHSILLIYLFAFSFKLYRWSRSANVVCLEQDRAKQLIINASARAEALWSNKG